MPGQQVGHHERQDRQRQRQRHAEAPLHVVELGVAVLLERHGDRLERHAAFRACARPDLAHLRIHRTRVLAGVRSGGSRRRRVGSRRLGVQERLGVALEPFEAARVAEVVRLPLVVELPRCVGGIDRHPADGIEHLGHFTYCFGLASNLVLQLFAQK